jgi:hypothetical protein
LYLAISLLSLAVWDFPENAAIESSKEEYMVYASMFQGKCDPETEQAIESEFQRIDSAELGLRKLYDDYYDGKMTKEALERESAELEASLANARGFGAFYSQYVYVRENPENRYFMYTNGWSGLLADDSSDILLVLLILLLVVPVFCYERESSMDELLKTMRRGSAYQAACKALLASAVMVCLCLISACLRLAFYGAKYGLPEGGFPLQSLPFFKSSQWNVSLSGAFALITSLKVLGALYFAAIILAVSALLKNYASSALSCASLVALPSLGLGASWIKYFLPLPLGLMSASGYLRGSEFERDMFTDEMVPVFKEVPASYFLSLLIASAIIAAMLIALSAALSKNQWIAGFNQIPRALGVLTLFSMLCGCAKSETHAIFNSSTKTRYENDQFSIYFDEHDPGDMKLIARDKSSGAEIGLARSPFRSAARISRAIYGEGDLVYYFMLEMDESKLRPNPGRIYVIELDLRDFGERVIFEANVNPYRDSFLGLVDGGRADTRLLSCDALFVDDRNIYIASDDIFQIDRITHETKTLPVPATGSYAYDGDCIWHITHRGEVAKYNVLSGEERVLPGIVATCFYLEEDELFFISRLDGHTLHSLSLITGETRKISDTKMLYFYCDSEFVHYQGFEDYTLYRMDKSGGNSVAAEGGAD